MKKFVSVAGVISLVLAVFFGLSAPVLAQSARGALAGNVTDPTGAVIPGATIVVVNTADGGKSQATSSSSGNYRFPDLPIGNYTVTTKANGFATSTAIGVQVTINSVTSQNIQLKIGAQTDVVTVDASGLQLETQTSDISGTISQKQIDDLPLSLAQGVGGLRSPETFVFLIPGTTGPGSGGATGLQTNGVFLSKLSGGQNYGAEVLLDGSSITRSENGSSFDETSPSIEALQEFKVTTSTPSAEFGRTTAGIESFAIKSGTNDFHGTGFAIVKNRAFDANNWFNNGYKAIDCVDLSELACSYSKPQDQKYDYGGTFGGPVVIPHLFNGHDRTFFFFAWEKYQLHLGTVVQSTVPTAAARMGDFSAFLGGPTNSINPCTGQAILQNQIFDPQTASAAVTPNNPSGQPCRQPFMNNKLTQVSPIAQKIIAGLPLPNQPGTPNFYGNPTNNYVQAGTAPTTNTTYTIRIDQNLSTNSKLFASYSSRDNNSLHGANDLPYPYNNGSYTQDFVTHYARAGWDYTLSPTLLNHLNLGYNRTNSNNVSQSFSQGPSATSLGIANEYSTAFPIINFDGLDGLSSYGQQQLGDNIDNGIRVNDSVNWQKGRNSFKFGVDYRHQQYSTLTYNTNNINFLRSETDATSFCPNAFVGLCQFVSGNSFASLLLGQVDNAGQGVTNHTAQWNSHYYAFFVEDDVKVSPNLTLNLGIRYDVDVPRQEKENNTSDLSLTAPDAAAGGLPGALVFGTNCKCNTAWANTWYKDIAPRVGFAYVLPGTDNKMVLRGGGAIIYGPLQYSDFGGSVQEGYNQARGIGSPATIQGTTTAGGFTPAYELDPAFATAYATENIQENIVFAKSNFAPNLDPAQLTAPNGIGSFGAVGGEVILPNNGRPSATYNWSLQLQYELAKDLLFSLGYIGQAAQNLHSGFLSNINNISPSYFALGDHLNDRFDIIPLGGANSNFGTKAPYANFTGALGQALRPFPQYDYIAGDCCLENLGHSSYDAMVVSLQRRFRQGFNLQASYTWSKNLTDADSELPFSVEGEQVQGQSSGNLRLEKAVSLQNIPQTFSLSYLYQFPFGKGRKFLNHNRALDYVVGGWEVGAIQRYQSGQPIPFGCATGIPYYQNCISYTEGPAAAGHNFASAAYRKNKEGPNFFNGQSWFKPLFNPAGANGGAAVPLAQAAFVDQNAEGTGLARQPSPTCPDGCSYTPFSFGNIPRVTESITGPIYKAEDVSLIKNFAITERVKFQFKAEVFDIFNRHRFGLPNLEPSAYNSPTGFGIPTYTDYGPRNMQLTGRINF